MLGYQEHHPVLVVYHLIDAWKSVRRILFGFEATGPAVDCTVAYGEAVL